MDITNMIPPMSFSGSRPMQSAVNLAVLGKALDTAQIQGEAMEEMMQSVSFISDQRLDTYA